MATTKVDINLISATGTASSGTFLRGDSSWGAVTTGFTQGTEQATTSGTSFTFGSIPAGVDMIVMNFNDVSISGTDYLSIELGDSGGIETSGYEGTRAGLNNTSHAHNNQTDAFPIQVGGAAEEFSGPTFLTLQDATNHTWCWTHLVRKGDYNIAFGAGRKELTGELTQVHLKLSGSNTFDAGAVNIMYI